VAKAHRDHRVELVDRVRRDLKETPERRVIRARKGSKVTKEIRVSKAIPARQPL
jgi:hypothetical protein